MAEAAHAVGAKAGDEPGLDVAGRAESKKGSKEDILRF